jgi:AcrR family transcriptional regulator
MGRRKLIEDHNLLAVARDVFVKQGFAASTREIARRAGISEAVIYQRHATKAHLFFAAMVPPGLERGGAALSPFAVGLEQDIGQDRKRLTPGTAWRGEASRGDRPRHDRALPRVRADPSAAHHPSLVRLREVRAPASRLLVRADAHRPGGSTSLFAALHCLAILERVGVHGGRFDDGMIRAIVRALWTGLAPKKQRTR